jgi:hypothetical protein
MNLLRLLDARFFSPAPAERLATVRVLTGAFALVYLLARGNVLSDFRHAPGRFEPVGIAAWLRAPLPPALVFALYILCVLSGVAFTLGIRFRASGPLFALLALWVTSYRNSFGMIFHTENLLILHLCVLGVSDAGAALSREVRAEPAPSARFGWPLWLISAVSVMAYVLAGIAKLKVTGVTWVDGDVLRNYVAYDAMRKAQIGSIHSPFGAWLVQFAWPFPVLSVLTMLLELLGPLAMLNPKTKLVWVLGLWGFHVGVFASMAIAFPYPLTGIAFASMFECEKLWGISWLAPIRRFLRGAPLATPEPRSKLGES